MEKLLESLQRRDKREIEEINFNIERFEGTEKAVNWISEYEEECKKYKIKSDEEKVKGLRKYLGKTAKRRYQTNLLKAGGHNWELWFRKQTLHDRANVQAYKRNNSSTRKQGILHSPLYRHRESIR